MLLMVLIMTAPLWGIGVFYWFSGATAWVAYLILVGFSLFFDWLMMGAMQLPVQSGPKGMIGKIGRVLTWDGDSGTVFCEGEVWKARSLGGESHQIDDRVEVEQVDSMVLLVKPPDRELR
ncbi:MAG: NfeD family protein [Acidobacteriota bacterium]|jgi:membrane-bound serine protease (ClpP class)